MDKNTLIHNSFTLSPWMSLVLELKGIDLIVFSVVYSISKTCQSEYYGGTRYINNIFGIHKTSTLDSFNKLVGKGYIIKVANVINGVSKPKYYANIKLIDKLIDKYLKENNSNNGNNGSEITVNESTTPTDEVGNSYNGGSKFLPGRSEIPTGVVGNSYHNNINSNINNNINNNKYMPNNLFFENETKLTGKEEDEKLKAEFDVFRKRYPGGGKNGIDTEWKNFKNRYKDYKKIVPILNESLDIAIQRRDAKKKLNLFVADWKYFSTWINNRCWEESFNESESDIQAKKESNVELGYGEFIKDGIRTYGNGKVSVPMDAPKRPSNNYAWSDVSKQWVYLV